MKKKLLLVAIISAMMITMGSCGDQRLPDAQRIEEQEQIQEIAEIPEENETEQQEMSAAEAEEEQIAEKQAEPETVQNITVEGNGYSVEVKSAKTSTDYAGNPIILVECVFTNNNAGPEAFGDVVGYTASQNGNRLVSEGENLILDMSVLMPMRQEIGSGQSITVNIPFAGGDASIPLDIEISIFDASTTYASGRGQIPIISA